MSERSRMRKRDMEARGPRAALRPFHPWDGEAVKSWKERIAKANLNSHRLSITLSRNLSLLGTGPAEGEGALIGLLDYRLNHPSSGYCAIDFILIEPRRRGYGLGSEAVRAFEEALRKKNLAQAFAASIPVDKGLAFYFWLRLGYRPASEADLARRSLRGDTMWMIRTEQNLKPRT